MRTWIIWFEYLFLREGKDIMFAYFESKKKCVCFFLCLVLILFLPFTISKLPATKERGRNLRTWLEPCGIRYHQGLEAQAQGTVLFWGPVCRGASHRAAWKHSHWSWPFLQSWWGQHPVLGLANMDVQHVLIKDVTKRNRARAELLWFPKEKSASSDHRFAGSLLEHLVYNEAIPWKPDDYGWGSIGKIGGTRSAWETALSRGGCDRLQGHLCWEEYFFFPGSEKGPHSQRPELVPAGYPAMHRWHHGSLTPLDITCSRGYLEMSSNVLLVTGSAMTPWYRSRSYTANSYWPDKLTSWRGWACCHSQKAAQA